VIQHEFLESVAADDRLLEIARTAIEDQLIGFRDSRLSQPLRGNGLVVKERNGESSSIIRFGPEIAVQLGLRAIAAELERRAKEQP